MDEEIANFVAITGTSDDVARGFIELAGGDYERAVTLFFENPELATSIGAGASTAAPAASSSRRTTGRSNRAGREDASGVIHIDDDDDDDEEDDDYMEVDNDFDSDDDAVAATHAANMAQEEEDAAMAKRLQEELYQQGSGSGGGATSDDVRAPIGRTTETLIAPNPSWGEDDDDDHSEMQAAFLEQLRRRRNMPQRGGGPFSSGIWADGNPTVTGNSNSSNHARRLEELFRPPFDLMARLEWDEVRELGKEDKKWILVNLQDMSDFNCQALNRDIWKDEAVRALVQENFLFLQYDKDHPDAQEYITFYFPNRGHENPENYPHVSIVDPRTGEQVKVWSGRPFPKAADFHASLAEFLDRYSLAANSKNPVVRADAPKPRVVDVDRMTEDEMLEMALKNSLAGRSGSAGESSGATSTPSVADPDALTKAIEPEAAVADSEEDAAARAFGKISSSNPHSEPDNDPTTTTRIQFRHPTGRVIRRFALADPVRRIFEWLKAEPLEGRDGVPFELKKMPQGQDLLGGVEETIAEAGLKQGTVMIEFIQD